MQIRHGVHQKIKLLQVLPLVGFVAISWYDRKQRFVALSSAEAKYMVASQATCEAIWMRKIIMGIVSQEIDLIVIYFDN